MHKCGIGNICQEDLLHHSPWGEKKKLEKRWVMLSKTWKKNKTRGEKRIIFSPELQRSGVGEGREGEGQTDVALGQEVCGAGGGGAALTGPPGHTLTPQTARGTMTPVEEQQGLWFNWCIRENMKSTKKVRHMSYPPQVQGLWHGISAANTLSHCMPSSFINLPILSIWTVILLKGWLV